MRIVGVFTVLAAVVFVQSELPEGYIQNKADGKAYKLVYQSKTWQRAVMECEREGGSLAVPKSEDEFQFIQRLVRGMYLPNITGTEYQLLVWLGISNLNDYRVWTNIDGENIKETGFNVWATNGGLATYSNDPKEPHCAGLDATNPGLRDYWCHLRQPFICQINDSSKISIHHPVKQEEKANLDLDLDGADRIRALS